MLRLPVVLLVTIVITACMVALLSFITDWSSPIKADAALTLIANLLLVSLTACYVALTYSLLKTQTEPCVVLYAKREGNLVYLVVENIGKGLARDIKFKSSEKMMTVPAALACTFDARVEEMQEGLIMQGIPALAPGQSRRMLWGPLHVLSPWLRDRTIVVTCIFSDNTQPAKPIDCPLELHSLSFTGEEYVDAVREVSNTAAEAMRRIS